MKNEKAKHTPGPWAFNHLMGEIHTDIGADWETDTGNIVADIKIAKIYGGIGSQHNAALIAAAPELLAVCEKMVDDWHEDNNNMDRPEPKYLEMARAAIAKAKGK